MPGNTVTAALETLPLVAQRILDTHSGKRIFAFEGTMGAGKTTLIKAICRVLGVRGNVSSPTFALVNEYLLPGGDPVYHFDFYRIKNIAEVMDIGYEHYFFSAYYCLIEWPEKITELLPAGCVYIRIEESGEEGIRRISF
ncbi:MAG TPA: tRNA (adenosine(37)-N6)-threonylcarbamoyltransferase complex ATPase subunit type 1 TsaE [Bacteroidales bacterium]|nr:tRNA (adenosine(37)-N6)-threonylcarbamoyltransferase complex ATPase subunit type 1 TsaE [Bacteroidales bacterium]HSA43627.1 tRNA (adenosine(37)-N6)-threonylcarbamoyltransferase complex ATPase subunit type 1 TsaE [Bacteroidales bacterium]